MKKFSTIISFSLLILCSCNNRTVYIKTDSLDGIDNNGIVKMNGIEIGEVENISLEPDFKILIEISIKKALQIPKGAKFEITPSSFLAKGEINIIPGSNKQFWKNNDTITGLFENKKSLNDSISVGIQKFIEDNTGLRESDSILRELRRLNSNLEKLKKVTN